MVAVYQHAGRTLWRSAGKPRALFFGCVGRHSQTRGAGLYFGCARRGRRGAPRRPHARRRSGHCPLPGQVGHGGFFEHHPRPHRHRCRPDRRDTGARHAQRAAPGLCGQPARACGHSDLPCRQDPGRQHRAPRHCQRQARHGGHDARTHGRPPHRAQDHDRPRRHHPPLRGWQLLPGPHLCRGRGLLHSQPLYRARAHPAPCSKPGAHAAQSAGGRRRPCGHGSGACRV